LGIAVSIAAMAAPAAADAALHLTPIMHAWRSNLHVMEATGSAATSPETDRLRHAIQSYIEGATMVAGQLNGTGAQAQDFRNRFLILATEGRKALGDIGRPASLRTDTARIKAVCASCHAVYNN
jgi:hypothetical protein